MKIQIETTLRFNLTSQEWLISIKQVSAHIMRCGASIVDGTETCTATVEITLLVPRKLEADLLRYPDIPLLGIYSKDVSSYYRDTCFLVYWLSIHHRQKLETT